MYIFPKRCEGADELKYIFPSKQKAVQKAIELAMKDSRIKRLIIFGSALDVPNMNFDEFTKLARPFFTEIPSEVDIIHYNEIRSELLKTEINRGVCVYAG